MLTPAPAAQGTDAAERVRRTVALLRRRGYAARPARLGELCLGGPLPEGEVLEAVAGVADLGLALGLVVDAGGAGRAREIAARAREHPAAASVYAPMTLRFVARLAALPFVVSVAIAGSLASGGFRASDDVDLNLVVEDGHRHLAYLALNGLGFLHALGHRAKPVDTHSRRPLAPRLMTANMILERGQCFPLERQDEDMAFELLQSQPVYGSRFLGDLVAANPGLAGHFPQLATRPPADLVQPSRRLPAALFPALLDRPAEVAGRAAWRYMQWTRRRRPEALARVAFVRETMRPYNLFPGR